MNPAGGFAHKPTLVGELVELRPFTGADIASMGPILADPEVLRLTGSVHSSAEAASGSPVLDERSLRWYETRAEAPDRLDLAIIDGASGACVGEVVLNDWEPENRSCNFRILIGPAGRNRGLGTEATRLLLDYAFGHTDLLRIGLEVYAFNPRAQHVYEQCGFRLEGTRRDALRFDGHGVDAHVMSVLRADSGVHAVDTVGRPVMIVIRGNSGSGKSTIARDLRDRLGAAWIEQDHFRRVVLGEHGNYTPVTIDLIETAVRTCLAAGRHVVVDGIFNAAKYSDMFVRLAALPGNDSRFFAFDLEFGETLQRHGTRGAKAAEFGEHEMRGWYHGWNPLSGIDEVRLGMELDPGQVVDVILSAIGSGQSREGG